MKNFEEFESLENKASVFEEWEKILYYAEYEDELIKLFGYLSDEEKMQVTHKPYFKEQLNANLRLEMIQELSAQNQMNYFRNEDVSEFMSLEPLIDQFPDDLKMEIIESEELQSKLGIYRC